MNRVDPSPPDRVSAVALGVGSLLMLLAMAHHPTGITHAHDVHAMQRGAALAAWVHGVLIALMTVILWGFLALVDRLGWRSRRARGGLVAYALGVVWMSGAALVSGFVGPRLALDQANRGGTGPLAPVLRFGWEANQAMAQAGTVALSVAIALWSSALLRHGTWGRVLGIAGLAIGIGVPAALIPGKLHLDVGGMGAVLVAQAAWTVGVSVWIYLGAPGRAGRGPSQESPAATA